MNTDNEQYLASPEEEFLLESARKRDESQRARIAELEALVATFERNEIPFDTAAKIVIDRMSREVVAISKRSDANMPHIQLDVQLWSDDQKEPEVRWFAKPNISSSTYRIFPTLDEAISGLPRIKSQEEILAEELSALEEKRAKVEAEILALKVNATSVDAI